MITINNPITNDVEFCIYVDTLNKVLECHFFTADEASISRYIDTTIKYRDSEYPEFTINNEEPDVLKDEEPEFGPVVKPYVEMESK